MKLATLSILYLLPAMAASITVLPSTLNPGAGDVFTAEVRVTDVFGGLPGDELILFGFDVVVSDAAAVTYTGATPGPLFDAAGLASAAVSGFPLAFSLKAGDFEEPLLLATLVFERILGTSVTIGVTSDPDTNPDHGLFYLGTVLAINATVTLGSVPEPSTLGMVIAATLAICVSRRSRFLR